MKIFTFILSILLSFSVSAQTRLSVEGSGNLYPIAIPSLCASNGDTRSAQEIAKVVSRDLDLSGYFDILDPDAFIETSGRCVDPKKFVYSDWSVLGIEGLVRGQIENRGGSVKVQLYLFDVQIKKLELAKEYVGEVDQISRIAHKFANEVIKYFTGEFGPFGTKVAFSGKVGRFKEVFVMDVDGANLRQLTDDKGLAASTSWSPDNSILLFSNFRNRRPDLFTMRVLDKRYRRVTNTLTMEIGAKYSRDGKRILTAHSSGKKSDIVLLDSSGNIIKNLTSNYSTIDVSPAWSPDNSKVVFTSNRAGGPQIYTMNANGTNIRRVSYVRSNYCTSPDWSPKGDKIAYVCRSERRHHLFVSNADGSNPIQLTVRGSNEDPTWSPDGRYIIFSSNFGRDPVYNLAMIRVDGANLRKLTNSRTGSFDPSWSGWID